MCHGRTHAENEKRTAGREHCSRPAAFCGMLFLARRDRFCFLGGTDRGVQYTRRRSGFYTAVFCSNDSARCAQFIFTDPVWLCSPMCRRAVCSQEDDLGTPYAPRLDAAPACRPGYLAERWSAFRFPAFGTAAFPILVQGRPALFYCPAWLRTHLCCLPGLRDERGELRMRRFFAAPPLLRFPRPSPLSGRCPPARSVLLRPQVHGAVRKTVERVRGGGSQPLQRSPLDQRGDRLEANRQDGRLRL